MKGKITTWGIQEVEVLKNAPKIVIMFDTEDGNRKFESFFFKKDGDFNKNTIKTLFTCGFRGDDLSVLAECDRSSLDMSKEFDLELESDGAGYEKVKWVNDPDFVAQSFGLSDKKKLGGIKIGKALKEANAKFKQENTREPKGIDESDEIPF